MLASGWTLWLYFGTLCNDNCFDQNAAQWDRNYCKNQQPGHGDEQSWWINEEPGFVECSSLPDDSFGLALVNYTSANEDDKYAFEMGKWTCTNGKTASSYCNLIETSNDFDCSGAQQCKRVGAYASKTAEFKTTYTKVFDS